MQRTSLRVPFRFSMNTFASHAVIVGVTRFWLSLAFCASGLAQTRFDVVSIKPVADWPPVPSATGERGSGGGCPTSMTVDPARVDFRCVNLRVLIGYAFRVSPDRVTGPGWMSSVGSPRFHIAATLPAGTRKSQIPEMVGALLADRFRLVTHRSSADATVLALVAVKGGPKLRRAQVEEDEPAISDSFYGAVQTAAGPDGTLFSSPRMGTVHETGDPYDVQRWDAPSTSLAGLAELLDQVAPVSLPIVDMTGLVGRYSLRLEVSLKDTRGTPPSELEPAVVAAFNRGLAKLGLRLDRRKGPVETIVVDRVEKSPIEN